MGHSKIAGINTDETIVEAMNKNLNRNCKQVSQCVCTTMYIYIYIYIYIYLYISIYIYYIYIYIYVEHLSLCGACVWVLVAPARLGAGYNRIRCGGNEIKLHAPEVGQLGSGSNYVRGH